MAQVIIYENATGGVSVTVPTGELPIEQVLTKDCPENAIIVDDSELPQDTEYFNAWELVDGVVIINEAKKAEIIAKQTAATSTKESALSKLTALGLTADEVKALLGVQ
jgi:hypothetical protein